MNGLQDNAIRGFMQAWKPVDKMWVTGVQTGGKSPKSGGGRGKAAFLVRYANYDGLARDLDFFLIIILQIYDYI